MRTILPFPAISTNQNKRPRTVRRHWRSLRASALVVMLTSNSLFRNLSSSAIFAVILVTQLRRNQPLRQGQPPNPLVQDQNRAEQNITSAMVTVMTKTTTVVVAGTAVTVAAQLVRNGNTVTATNARASTRRSSTLLRRRPKHLLDRRPSE